VTRALPLQCTFGANWLRFIARMQPATIARAEQSLRRLLECESLAGKTFLDIGSGSGLFSLAARRLAATVHSLDSDAQSVACTQALKDRFAPADENWRIDHASILDAAYLAKLAPADIVYSWGVLHHTGALWQALAAAGGLVRPGGLLAIAIYNDQGRASRRWAKIKRCYVNRPLLRPVLLLGGVVRLWGPTLVRDTLRGDPLTTWRRYGEERGMSPWRDVVDWIGGWPFEVASPRQVIEFLNGHGFTLLRLHSCQGHGCNEFLFRKDSGPAR
jgi:SAM-dependent methyltransferase